MTGLNQNPDIESGKSLLRYNDEQKNDQILDRVYDPVEEVEKMVYKSQEKNIQNQTNK